MKIDIENLKAQMQGFDLNIYQKADALIEFNKLLDYVNELEQLKLNVVGVSEAEVCCFNCKHSASDIDFCTGMSVNCGKFEQT